MAFQAGNIKISGSIDGLSFYHSVFGWLVRRKGGPSRKQFKTSPAFVRSRENSSEFTACARAAAAVRRLVLIHTGGKDKTLYHRLIKLMRLLANDDQHSIRGQRDPLKGMQTSQGQARLKEFKISGDLCLYDSLLQTGFFKEPSPNVKESNTIMIPPASGKRRLTKKRPVYDTYSKPLLAQVALRQPGKQTLPNTAFG